MIVRCSACWAKLKVRIRKPCLQVRCPACGAVFTVYKDGLVSWIERPPEGEWLEELLKRSRN